MHRSTKGEKTRRAFLPSLVLTASRIHSMAAASSQVGDTAERGDADMDTHTHTTTEIHTCSRHNGHSHLHLHKKKSKLFHIELQHGSDAPSEKESMQEALLWTNGFVPGWHPTMNNLVLEEREAMNPRCLVWVSLAVWVLALGGFSQGSSLNPLSNVDRLGFEDNADLLNLDMQAYIEVRQDCEHSFLSLAHECIGWRAPTQQESAKWCTLHSVAGELTTDMFRMCLSLRSTSVDQKH